MSNVQASHVLEFAHIALSSFTIRYGDYSSKVMRALRATNDMELANRVISLAKISNESLEMLILYDFDSLEVAARMWIAIAIASTATIIAKIFVAVAVIVCVAGIIALIFVAITDKFCAVVVDAILIVHVKYGVLRLYAKSSYTFLKSACVCAARCCPLSLLGCRSHSHSLSPTLPSTLYCAC
jgi:hypothetical protein